MEFSKWDGRRHWHFAMEDLGADRHGRWFSGPPGTRAKRGDEDHVVEVGGFVTLVPAEGDWIANWNRTGDVAVYVDITDTPVVAGGIIRAVDLDLDVIAWRDGTVEVIDRDDFEAHSVSMAYPPELIARAEATAATVEGLMRGAEAPFDGTGAGWLDTAATTWS
jgi:hypothetical protein